MPPVSLFKFPPPPTDTVPFEGGKIFTTAWQRWFLLLQKAFITAVAPGDAPFFTFTASAILTAAQNLGALASGYLKITTLAGVATASTVVVLSSQLEPADNVSIPANESAIVADRFVIAAGKTLTIGAGAVFQIT